MGRKPKGPKGKGLSPERAAAARRFIKDAVDRAHGGKAALYAAELGVAQSGLADFLGERAGVGLNVLEKVADHERVMIDTVVGRSGMPVSNDLDQLEILLRERLAEVMRQKRHRSPSGFPQAMAATKALATPASPKLLPPARVSDIHSRRHKK